MRLSIVAATTLALLLACNATVTALTSEDAVAMAVEAEDIIGGLSEEVEALTVAPSTESTETVDGIEYTVVTYVDPETGKTLKQTLDPDGNLVKEEYSDPETGILVTTEYDETGNVVSNSVATVDEDGSVLQSTTIEYNDDGTKTYTAIDYSEPADNKVTTTVEAGGDITNPDDIIDQTVETQLGMPNPPTEPTEQTCPNTGQSEIDV